MIWFNKDKTICIDTQKVSGFFFTQKEFYDAEEAKKYYDKQLQRNKEMLEKYKFITVGGISIYHGELEDCLEVYLGSGIVIVWKHEARELWDILKNKLAAKA